MFGRYKIEISECVTVHILNIDIYSSRLKEYIDNNIIQIWNGDNDEIDNDISIVKQELINLIKNKSEAQKHGIVAEFICHLYLRANKFNQHFLFSNLEEKGMKKGFDGLYGINDAFYIFESKSSLETTQDTSHNANISEAYNDLKRKVEGSNTSNNPWKNAYNHSMLRSIKFNESISKTLKKLSNDYTKQNYPKIDSFNIIPSSTLFLGSRFEVVNKHDLLIKITRLIKNYKFNKSNIVCVNKSSIDNFIAYLNE